jgi:hypothetical protein
MWRVIPDYPNYEVSDQGEVRSIKKQLVLKPFGNPYKSVRLYKDGKRKTFLVHRLVLLTFVGDPPSGHECLHKDHDPTNNRLSNLMWGTKSLNCSDRPNWISPTAKLTDEDKFHILFLRKFGYRNCEIMIDFNLERNYVSTLMRKLARNHYLNRI